MIVVCCVVSLVDFVVLIELFLVDFVVVKSVKYSETCGIILDLYWPRCNSDWPSTYT